MNKISFYTIKAKTAVTASAVLLAVVLPQILHLMGHSLGEMLLPMHLPVMIAGMVAGPIAGAVTGILSPVVSFILSGMPSPVILPFMVIELCAYGFFSGIFTKTKLPSVLKVLLVQFVGRLIRAAAILIAVFIFGYGLNPMIILTSISTGAIGIIIQLVLLPLIEVGRNVGRD